MKKLNTILLFCFFAIGLALLNAQDIVKVVPEYVLIDKDTGLGKLDEPLLVYRIMDGEIVKIGRVRIIKFQKGRTAAKIVLEETGYKIEVGDVVSIKRLDRMDISRVAKKMPAYRPQIKKPPETKESKKIKKKTMHAGLHIGRFIPAADMESRFKNSFTFGLSVKLIKTGRNTFSLDGDFHNLKTGTSTSDESKSSLMTVHITDHIRVGNQIHYDFGVGLYLWRESVTLTDQTFDENKSYWGVLLGFSADLSCLSELILSPCFRVHMYKTDKGWNGFATVGINIYLAVF